MELLEWGELPGLIEQGKVVADELPVRMVSGAAGMLDELVDVAPVAKGAGRVVAGGLDFQSDEVFEVDDRNAAIRSKRESLGSLKHAEAQRREQRDARGESLNGSGWHGKRPSILASRVSMLFACKRRDASEETGGARSSCRPWLRLGRLSGTCWESGGCGGNSGKLHAGSI